MRRQDDGLPTGHSSVLFDATVAGGLIGHLVGGLSGGALYRQSSFLTDSLGTQILPQNFCICEEPHIARALGSAISMPKAWPPPCAL